jgi:hypothetical protein
VTFPNYQIISSTKLPPPDLLKRKSTFQYIRIAESLDGNDEIGFGILSTIATPLRPRDNLLPPFAEESINDTKIDPQSNGCELGCASSEDTVDANVVARLKSFHASKSNLEMYDDTKCFVCWLQESDAILLDCGHAGICVDCALKLWAETRRCPLCRQPFAAIMHVLSSTDATVHSPTRRAASFKIRKPFENQT